MFSPHPHPRSPTLQHLSSLPSAYRRLIADLKARQRKPSDRNSYVSYVIALLTFDACAVALGHALKPMAFGAYFVDVFVLEVKSKNDLVGS